MIEKVLIANRGEIALRVIRACRDLDIKSVAVFSQADRDSLHVSMADEAICIGPAPAAKSYLNMSNLISAAKISGADAIHPGYGFLAENAEFATLCADNDIIFIGPSPEAIRKMGDKAVARDMMAKAKVPIIPGTEGIVKNMDSARLIAEQVGYPVIIKAVAGGGGRGMRVVPTSAELESGFNTASMEAKNAFGNGDVYIEKYIEEPRHIEFQILADNYGNVIHLGERDCSLQRRHQKLLEESPSMAIDDGLRAQMGKDAVMAAKAANYSGAGTIEFLVDKNGNYYFIEMNTRIQVEHPVTEMVTNTDLVKEQILIAGGKQLDLKQKDIKITGWAIECRINAEDPENDFRPCPGKIVGYIPAGGPGVRVDSFVHQGYEIKPYYDSLIAKLIVHGRDRNEAIARMRRALVDFRIEGVKTTIPFHLRVLSERKFLEGKFSTAFLQELQI